MVRDFPDPRVMIKEKLEEIGIPVLGEYPAGKQELPLITYAQVANAYLTNSTARIVYQVDAWTNSFADAIELAGEIDHKMQELNFRRIYESPDSVARENIDLYHKALSYETTADLILDRFM